MATPTVLHAGNDICQRIPVMETASFAVFQAEDSILAIRKAFAGGDCFSAITFHADLSAPSSSVVWAARRFSAAPFVLFENPSVYYERSYFDFDIVIPTLAPPSFWLKKLHDVIEVSRELRERSSQLRQECAIIQSAYQAIRAVSDRAVANPIYIETLWRGKEDDPSTKH